MWERVVLPGDSSIQWGAYRVKHGSPTSDQYRFFHVEIWNTRAMHQFEDSTGIGRDFSLN